MNGNHQDLESLDQPEDTPELRPLIQEVLAWTGEAVDLPVLDVESLMAITSNGEKQVKSPKSRGNWALRVGWLMVAAASLLLVLSFSPIRVEWGGIALQIGGVTRNDTELPQRLEALEARFNLERNTFFAAMQDLKAQTRSIQFELHKATTDLVRAQEAESMTRYNDISRLLYMTSNIP